MKFGIFYEHQLPRPWDARQRVRAAPARPRPDRARRPARLRLRLGGRAPLPRGVLPLVGARGVPRRRQPAHEATSASATASCSSRRTTRRGSPSGCRTLDLRQPRPRRARHRRGSARRPSCTRSTAASATSARCGRTRCAACIPMFGDGRLASTTASTSTSRCATSCPKPRQKPHPPLWVACSQLDTIEHGRPAGHGRARLPVRVGATRPQAWVARLLQRLHQAARSSSPTTRTNPNIAVVCGVHVRRRPTRRRSAQGRRLDVLPVRPALLRRRTARCEPGTVNLWEEYQAFRKHARRARRRRPAG